VFVVLGDGELDEGSVWEAALVAGAYKLDNLVAIVDRNQFQANLATEELIPLEPLAPKFEAFGFAVVGADGHDFRSLGDAFAPLPRAPGKPTAIIARTTKGRGISFMEGIVRWHHGVPTDDEYTRAVGEIDARIAALSGRA